MRISNKLLGFVAGIVASIFWGFHAVLIRYLILDGVSPFAVATFRLLIGSGAITILYLIMSLFRKNIEPLRFKYGKFFWFAVLSLGINFPLFHYGLKYTIASDAILLEAFSPIIVLLLVLSLNQAALINLIRFPKLLRNIFLIVAVGAVGSSLLIVNQPHAIAISPDVKVTGDIIEFFAMLFFAGYLFSAHEYQRRNPGESAAKVTAHFLFFSAILSAFFVPWGEITQYTSLQWIWIFILGFFSTSINYLLWQFATKTLDVVPLALLFSLSSIFNVAIESLVFNLTISPMLIFGAILILASSITTQYLTTKYRLSSGGDNVNSQ